MQNHEEKGAEAYKRRKIICLINIHIGIDGREKRLGCGEGAKKRMSD